MFKRKLPLLITFLVGVLVLVSEFIPHRPFNQISSGLEDWFLIISGFAIILGQMNLIKVNAMKVQRRVENWPYYLVALVAFAVMVITGLFWGTQESKGLLPGKFEHAATSFQRAVELDPHNVKAWIGLGESYAGRNHMGKAIDALNHAVELDPGDRDALNELAGAYDTRGDAELAQQTRDKLLAIPMHDAPIVPTLDEDALKAHVENMLKHADDQADNPDYWYDLGSAQYDAGDFAAATASLEKSVDLRPDNAQAQYMLGRSYLGGDETGTFVGGKKPFDYLFDNVYQHLSATMFALLAFFIASAAYRAFIGRTLESNLLLVAAVLVMLGNTTIGSSLTSWLPSSLSFLHLPNISAFIMKFPNTAGQRAIMICAGLGIIGSSLRIILGIERSYLGGD